MGVRVGNISAGKHEGDALHRIEPLLHPCQALAEVEYFGGERARKFFEGRVVLDGDDLDVPFPDRADVQEREEVVVAIDFMT